MWMKRLKESQRTSKMLKYLSILILMSRIIKIIWWANRHQMDLKIHNNSLMISVLFHNPILNPIHNLNQRKVKRKTAILQGLSRFHQERSNKRKEGQLFRKWNQINNQINKRTIIQIKWNKSKWNKSISQERDHLAIIIFYQVIFKLILE